MKLYQTWESEALIWNTELSSLAIVTAFSTDGSLIATAARYDKLVKIWRRRSYGSGDLQFDYSYLRHPMAVTSLQWRDQSTEEAEIEHILFTICADSKVRIWASIDPHSLDYLQLWSEIDIASSIQPRNPIQEFDRFIVFVDGSLFRRAIDTTSRLHGMGPIIEHLNDLSKDRSDVCMVFDRSGHLCVWVFNITKNQPPERRELVNMIYTEDVEVFQGLKPGNRPPEFLSFIDAAAGSQSMVIVSDDSIDWFEGQLGKILDPTQKGQQFVHKALLTGHEKSIEKINRTAKGRAIISRTADGENIVWQQLDIKDGAALRRHSQIAVKSPIIKSCLLSKGYYTVTLHTEQITLWKSYLNKATPVVSIPFALDGEPLCLLNLPVSDNAKEQEYLATVSTTMQGIVWVFKGPIDKANSNHHDGAPSLEQFCTFTLGLQDNLSFLIPVDPAGSMPNVSGFLDAFAQDVALSYTNKGTLVTWAAQVDENNTKVQWFPTATIETSITQPSLASGSSTRKVAVVDAERNGLSIWDTRSGQLEYGRTFAFGDTIQDLDWTSTPTNQSILAIGFPYKIMILAQIRYDYLDLKPAWAVIREIRTRDSTPHPIGDSTWLGSGSLVIGAGNQLFVYDKNITSGDENVKDLVISTKSEQPIDLFDVVALLNGPLPVYHPQFLSQCILTGKLQLVQRALVVLHENLKFYTEGDAWDPTLSIDLDKFTCIEAPLSKSRDKSSLGEYSQDEAETLTEDLALALSETLTKKSVPFLSNQEQFHLADLVECVATAEKHRRSMDENATRFFLFFRRYMLRKNQHKVAEGMGVTWRETMWAFHSDSQEILTDLVSRHYQGKLQWKHARESCLFTWMNDMNSLKTQFEIIARNEYTKSEDRNPIDCSLYYLALKKKSVLQGLWKMATWHREQAATLRMLNNNFDEPRWKTAALKNAYALMGKRRFGKCLGKFEIVLTSIEYAAAFFLLAGNVKDAVNICASQMQDIQLAIAVARVYDGDDSLVFHDLLEEKVLPLAAFEGDRWMASWAFWKLGRRDMAVRSLIVRNGLSYRILLTKKDSSLYIVR